MGSLQPFFRVGLRGGTLAVYETGGGKENWSLFAGGNTLWGKRFLSGGSSLREYALVLKSLMRRRGQGVVIWYRGKGGKKN